MLSYGNHSHAQALCNLSVELMQKANDKGTAKVMKDEEDSLNGLDDIRQIFTIILTAAP